MARTHSRAPTREEHDAKMASTASPAEFDFVRALAALVNRTFAAGDVSGFFITSALTYAGERAEDRGGSGDNLAAEMRAHAVTRILEKEGLR